jgi:glycosyltransferase involved in cell wall biosynthesis
MARPMTLMVNLLHAQETLTGTGYYARHLIEAFARMPGGPQVIGVASAINRAAFRLEGVPRERFRLLTWGRPWKRVGLRRIEEWLFLNGLIRRLRPDVFWCPSNFLPLWKTGPMAVTIHDMTFFEHPEVLPPVRRWYWHRWTHRTVRVADAIVTDTQASRSAIARWCGVDASGIAIVAPGTAPAFFIGEDAAGRPARRRALRERFPTLPERYVLFLGTLTAHKNVPRLVDAVAHARGRGCGDMRLVLAGKRGTGYEEIAAAVARHGLADAVVELGYVADDVLPALYENARTQVLPSFTEGFGLPIVEAMACGTPVVTSHSGAMAEVAGDAAELVDPYSVESMGEALARVWRDDVHHADLRGRGLARARLYTWEAAAEQLLEVFERLRQRA